MAQGCSPEDVATINRLVQRLELRNPHDREDASQEAWVGWLESGGNERATWSHLVAWKQREQRRPQLINETDLGEDVKLDDIASPRTGMDPVEEAEKGEEIRRLYAAINKLPEHLQDAMGLRAEGYTAVEIARLLDVSRGTVYRRIREGKKQLKLLLGRAGG